jgi:CheY-like chemotaxis protein
VLVVDDDESVRDLLTSILERAGYVCLTAHNVACGVELLQMQQVDVILTDLMMPGSTAVEVVPVLEQASGGGVPFIVLTGHPTVETAVESVARNVCAYLLKPVAKEVLLGAVERCLAHRSVRGSLARSLERLDSWKIDLTQIFGRAGEPRQSADMAEDAFYAMTLRNIIASLEDLSHLSAMRRGGARQPCHLFDCPRLDALSGALNQCVEVLEKTKNSFKSKELGALRVHLEDVLARHGQKKC